MLVRKNSSFPVIKGSEKEGSKSTEVKGDEVKKESIKLKDNISLRDNAEVPKLSEKEEKFRDAFAVLVEKARKSYKATDRDIDILKKYVEKFRYRAKDIHVLPEDTNGVYRLIVIDGDFFFDTFIGRNSQYTLNIRARLSSAPQVFKPLAS